ncbi:MAG: polysaccharide deacetylase family protein [Sulfitobacter sp.]
MGLLKRTVLAGLGWPLPYKALQHRALRGSPLTILCYHTLGPDRGGPDAWTALRVSEFRQQIAFLRKDYDIVSLDQALTPAENNPRPRVVLTFDDGDIGLFTHLLPIVEAEALPVTIYVATRQIETGQPYWFDRIMNALQAPIAMQIDLHAAGLPVWRLPETGGALRWQVISDVLERLKAVDPDLREDLTAQVVAQAPVTQIGPRLGPMSLEQLKTLAACPHVTIGAHSHCHNLLDQIPLAQAQSSAAHSRDLLQKWTGRKVAHFAYPNGNHTAPLRAAMAEIGFTSATVLDMALAQKGSDSFALSRLAVSRYDPLARFRLRLIGI